MADMFLRGWNWVRRFRHRCGYGVHSPSDFFLITFVVYEKMPYYAYSHLHQERKKVERFPHYREKTDKLLFRLVNYFQPDSVLEFGTGSGLETVYLATARKTPLLTVAQETLPDEVKRLLGTCPGIQIGEASIVGSWLEQHKPLGLVHIAHTPDYKEVFERLLPYVGSRTCFVIGAPYDSEEKTAWWKQVVADSRTGVTFDLYDIGLVFFDPKRVKEHRIVNFL
ncbi:hypothetical protein [uncultured Bacteroides sp.]|uniref:hypothetical protein n=1 Tax=uncultured Bacteroides sp. TaxID=162156 RepID=UPI00263790DD|nr:hypothetical protein [uncultured Bacteroides sp.]